MSDAAGDILKRMREDKVKDEPKVVIDPDEFYTKLVINKLRRRQLTLALSLAFCAFVAILAKDYRNHEKAWWVTGLPIAALGLIIAVIPATEEWEYKPWQARPRQYERHQIER